MKFLLFLLLSFSSQAQTLLSGRISGVRQPQTIRINTTFDCWYHRQLSQPVQTDAQGNFSVQVPVRKTQTIFLDFREERILLYVESHKNLGLAFDSAAGIKLSIRFSGQLADENNFRRSAGLSLFSLYPQSWNDTSSSPQEIIAAVRINQRAALKRLNTLNSSTSSAFQTITKADISYVLPHALWQIIYSDRDPLRKEDRPTWQQALQTAYGEQPLLSSAAVNSYYYQQMIAYYPRFFNLLVSDKKGIDSMLTAVLHKPAAEAMQEVKEKGEQFWEYQIIRHALQGLPLQYAIASFITNGIYSGELGYLDEAYSDFITQFPASPYRAHVDSIMAPYLASLAAAMPEKILFEPADMPYKSLAAILQKHKGRVVYIDLWGTWCGPCREEFVYNGALKARFAGKPVDFVYIAFEHSQKDPEPMWKKTVRYYRLTGRHLLGGAELKADLDKLYAPGGLSMFPSYILADKDGNIRSHAVERPSSGEALCKQIEQLLK